MLNQSGSCPISEATFQVIKYSNCATATVLLVDFGDHAKLAKNLVLNKNN